jgi:hypothetical protein
MEATLGRRSLEEEIAGMEERDQILHVDLKGRDPDAGFTGVPYEKGALFLRHLEETVGRERFDKFVRDYFDAHAFQSITTETFVDYLYVNLVRQPIANGADKKPSEPKLTVADVNEWINKAGLPKNAPQPKSDAFAKVEAQANKYSSGKIVVKDIQTNAWTTQEWLHFLKSLPPNAGAQRLAELDKAFNLTKTGNSEIAFQWLMMSIKNNYSAADARLEEFLTSIGRRKFVKPLFEELAKTADGMKRACAIYKQARSGYHPITQTSVDAIVKCN